MKLYMYVYECLFSPAIPAGYTHRLNFKQSTAGMNSEFTFSLIDCHTKAQRPDLLYYFSRALARSEMQIVSSSI